MSVPNYEIYAIKYAHNPRKLRIQHFLRHDLHDGPSPMDFFLWVAVSGNRKVVIDVGGTRENAEKRGHDFLRTPLDALQLVGVDPAHVDDVVITHMHWDHAGNVSIFPRAQFHMQLEEMRYATGPYMQHKFLRPSFAVSDVCDLVCLLHDGRLRYIEGTREIAPGIVAYLVGGHTPGQQIVRVHTARGWVVLASDAVHLYENMEAPNPFPVVFNVGDSLKAFDTIDSLAPSRGHVVPGHDPLVLRRYAAPAPDLEGIAAALHIDPVADESPA